MKVNLSILLFCSVLMLILTASCATEEERSVRGNEKLVSANISADLPWSERMAHSVMKRAPEAYMNDFQTRPKWNYTHGLILASMMRVAEEKGNKKYYHYSRTYGDTMIYEDGTIRDYEIEKFNIDHIAPGPFLFMLYDRTGEEKYMKAIENLKYQLDWQPTTTEGGYWHKLRYPWQMWLDGLFMGEPFLAEYASRFDKPELFDHIVHQFVLAEKHTRDPETGLLYHGWDESRVQRWSDPETGCSPHFWGRAMGWYVMGLVEVLEFLPPGYEKRQELIDILDRTLKAVIEHRDPETHSWWQVLNMPHKEGNYLESTASSMFTYAMLRGLNEGYLDASYKSVAMESYQALLDNFIKVDGNGEVHLTSCCSVAGLGGDPYRDGSYDYYISEPVRDNDPKGVGPFILASLEMEKAKGRL